MTAFEQLRTFLTQRIGFHPWAEQDDQFLQRTLDLEQFVCLKTKEGRIIAFISWIWYPDRLVLAFAGGEFINTKPKDISSGRNLYVDLLAIDPDFKQLNGSLTNLVRLLRQYAKPTIERARWISYHDPDSFFRRRKLTTIERGD